MAQAFDPGSIQATAFSPSAFNTALKACRLAKHINRLPRWRYIVLSCVLLGPRSSRSRTVVIVLRIFVVESIMAACFRPVIGRIVVSVRDQKCRCRAYEIEQSEE